MSTRRNSRPHRCPRCKIHQQYCFCAHINPLSIQTTLSLVVHVRELKLTSNTANFLKEMLPHNTHFDIRGQLNAPLDTAPIVARSGRALFLYPNDEAQELNAEFVARNPGPYHLIVPDGNWHQARKVHQREAGFLAIPTVKLPAGLVGEYQLRKAPQPHFLSTYEAVAHALGILEGPEVRDQLMTFFRIFVKSVMHSRTDFHAKLEL
jgi:DTW domain-containing protein YfiP